MIGVIMSFGTTLFYNVQYYFADRELKTNAPEYVGEYDPLGNIIDAAICWFNIVLMNFWIIGIAVLVLVFVWAILRGKRVAAVKDDQRMYTSNQREDIKIFAGNRCENRTLFFFRCRKPFMEADHIHPHTLGAPTTVKNGSALCKHHNASKGGRKPSVYYIFKLNFWRRFYDPRFKTSKDYKLNKIPFYLDPIKLQEVKGDEEEKGQI